MTIPAPFQAFLRDESGSSAVEYALMAAGMTSALISAFMALEGKGGLLSGVTDVLNLLGGPPPPPAPAPAKAG